MGFLTRVCWINRCVKNGTDATSCREVEFCDAYDTL